MAFINTGTDTSSGLQKGTTVYIIMITLVAALGGLLFGYDTAVVSGAEHSLVSFFITRIVSVENYANYTVPFIEQYRILLTVTLYMIVLLLSGQVIKLLGFAKGAVISIIGLVILSYWAFGFIHTPVPTDVGALQDTADAIKGFVIASALIGCIIGGASAGVISKSLGRRVGLFIAAAAFILSAVGAWKPEAFNFFGTMDVYSFTIYRIIGGIGVGIASMISPMYIAEIAPANVRGKLVSFNQFGLVFGILVIFFVNWLIARSGDQQWLTNVGWRWMFFSGVIPAGLFFILLFFVPETPRYLVMKGKDGKALEVLERIGDKQQAPIVLEQISATIHEANAPWLSYGFMVIFIGIMLSIFQQFVGINVVLYYAGNIFRNMGASTDSSLMQTLVVGAVNVVFTVVAIFTVDRFGRKTLLIIGSLGMAFSMMALGFSFYYQSIGTAALIFMLLFIASFAMSWGPVVWVLLAEIFPNSIRGAMSIAVSVQWVANWVVSFTFPMMNDNHWLSEKFHNGFAYWIYGAMGLVSALFVWKFIPETKGKTLEEIEKIWTKRNHKTTIIHTSAPPVIAVD
jgi:SP family xylose:H+ symportor-like MFS transporter